MVEVMVGKLEDVGFAVVTGCLKIVGCRFGLEVDRELGTGLGCKVGDRAGPEVAKSVGC